MLKTVTSGIRCVGLAAALIAVPVLVAQDTKVTAAAPVPVQIGAARKVFVANAGVDLAAQAAFKRAGEPEAAYNRFYAVMQSWGRYELVSTPADADLVLEVRFSAPAYYNGTLVTIDPQFGLKIFDTKTHFLLWSVSAPVEGAFRKATWDKNFSHGLDLLMDDLKKLAAPPTATGETPKK